MEEVVKLLTKLGWKKKPELFDSGGSQPRPLMLFGDFTKAVVGSTWVTFWRSMVFQSIDEMLSVRTDDLAAVRKTAKHYMEG